MRGEGSGCQVCAKNKSASSHSSSCAVVSACGSRMRGGGCWVKDRGRGWEMAGPTISHPLSEDAPTKH